MLRTGCTPLVACPGKKFHKPGDTSSSERGAYLELVGDLVVDGVAPYIAGTSCSAIQIVRMHLFGQNSWVVEDQSMAKVNEMIASGRNLRLKNALCKLNDVHCGLEACFHIA